MAHVTPPAMGYLPPPGGPLLQSGAPSPGHNQGPDALTTAFSGMTLSSGSNPASSLSYGSTQYHPASLPPPIPSASTRPVYQAQSPAPVQKPQYQYSPGYQHIQSIYGSSHPSMLSPAPTQQNPIGPPGQYGMQPQPGTPQSPVRRRPVGAQPQTLGHGAAGPSPQGPSYVYQPQPQYAHHSTEHQHPYNPPQPPAQIMPYAGPSRLSQGPQSHIQPQQPEKIGRSLLSSTGRLGAGLVGGFTTAVAGQQGKEKLEKWGKGKMNVFAGAMGYTPSAPSHAVGRPTGGPGLIPVGASGLRPISYAGPPGPRPVQYIPVVPGRVSGVRHPVATAMLAGVVGGGVGGVIGANLARDSDAYQPEPSTATGTDGNVVYDQTTAVGGSYADGSPVGGEFIPSSGGDASTAAFHTQYSGYDGPGSATVYTDTTVYADSSGTICTDTSTVYADTSGAVYTDTPTTAYADSSAYGQSDAYSGTTYTEASQAADSSYAGYGDTTYTDTSYAAESSYAGYGDATYTSGATVYTETAGVGETGSIAEAVTSSGGGSWIDNLGLGSLTDMSSWGGSSLDDGAAALALI